MTKEKQDRISCKHLECNMDGAYCTAGHGHGYGWCVLPFKQNECKYFEKKPKSKTVKINKNEVVISKEEYENLKNQVKELEKQRDEQAYITEDLIQEKHRRTEQARKETAREIYKQLQGHGTTYVKKWIKEQYGVDLGETK